MTQPATTPASRTAPGQIERHGSGGFDDRLRDPYQHAGKYREPARCEQCGAVWHGGRWQWAEAPAAAHATTCPACRRMHDELPAGVITLDGPFIALHHDELVAIARHTAEHERLDHPLNRIMQVSEPDGRIEITTTDIHLPQRIGAALKSAYDGELVVRYAQGEYSVRVHWSR